MAVSVVGLGIFRGLAVLVCAARDGLAATTQRNVSRPSHVVSLWARSAAGGASASSSGAAVFSARSSWAGMAP